MSAGSSLKSDGRALKDDATQLLKEKDMPKDSGLSKPRKASVDEIEERGSTAGSMDSIPSSSSHARYVFPDPVAFRYDF